MPSRIRASFDAKGAIANLESVKLGLRREVNNIVRQEAQMVALGAAQRMKRGPGPQSEKDNLPHIADTYSASAEGGTAVIMSSHPGAGVHEFGGTIAPKGEPITIAQSAPVHKAADHALRDFERNVSARLDRLLRRYGL